MYAAVVSSAVVAGLVTVGALAPSPATTEPRGRVVTASCASSSYAPAAASERAACTATYTGYGATAR